MENNKPYILYVEDDDLEVMKLKMAMASHNMEYPLEITTNGEEALTFLKSKLYDLPRLILLDLRMPRMNGFEFLEQLRIDEKLADIPVVIVSAKDFEPQEMQKLNESALEVFQKGAYKRHQLVETVRRLVDRRLETGKGSQTTE